LLLLRLQELLLSLLELIVMLSSTTITTMVRKIQAYRITI
jgi:hypothetical protein